MDKWIFSDFPRILQMCIYLDSAGVYIWRIYDTLETILRKMLTFRSATTNYSDKIYFQAADRSARG